MPRSNPLAQQTAEKTEPGDLVTEHEAAAILSAAVRTLRNWRALRKGPRYRKIGARLVRYSRRDLAEFQRIMDGDREQTDPA